MPTLAGKYELDRRLGIGGMAEVFLGRLVGKDGFARPVAIKRVLAHLATDETFVNLFVAEAQMCARLQHPNIVSVLDFDRDDEGRPFLVLELVDGPSLAALVDGRPLATESAIYIVTELLRGLGYAHDLPPVGDSVRGIVHRDISPHNVLLSWEGAVKLSDFGIAKARDASGVTASELLKGKPAYMSPEQANGEALDRRSDLFSVGIVLWELLAGRSLFSGSTTQETLARVLFAPIPSPRSIRTSIPADVDAVVMKLLERDRNDRYANAGDALAALVACKDTPRDGRGNLVALLADRFATDGNHGRRSLEGSPTEREPQASPLPSPRDAATRTRSRGILLALGALALTSVAVATTVIVLDRREPRTMPTPSPVLTAVVDATTADERGVALLPVPPTLDAQIVDAGDLDVRIARGNRVPVADARAPDPIRVAEPMKEKESATDAMSVSAEVSIHAVARNKWLQAHAYDGSADFPFVATNIRPDEIYARARREAERLFGKVEDGMVWWDGIQKDGTIDETAEDTFVWLEFAALTPEDDWHCFTVKVTPFGGSTTLQKQECSSHVMRPRCTGRQLHQRAVARGVPETALIGAALLESGWSVHARSKVVPDTMRAESLSIPNDCN